MTAFMREYVALFPALVAVSWIALGSIFVLRREWRLPLDHSFTPCVAVVVPAHNEELVIEATLDALLAQEYPALQIHVVSDGSTDATVEIARRFAGRGVIVHELSTNVGKSAALQHVLDRVDAELFMVVDADTRSRPPPSRCSSSTCRTHAWGRSPVTPKSATSSTRSRRPRPWSTP